jgi:NAD+ synthase
MQRNLLKINIELENKKIVQFIKNTFSKQKIGNAVIGLSGGIDSATSLTLLAQSLPIRNIFVYHLPYFDDKENPEVLGLIKMLKLDSQYETISIKESVDNITKELNVPKKDLLRKGNIMARVRMITLFDLAKKKQALVVGTENRSEHLLGYYTRFGDAASDIEPIMHLYKTQVYEMAKYLKIPDSIILKHPSAGLWGDQTDEKEFGFTYKQADQALCLYFDKNLSIAEIEKQGLLNAKKIIEFAKKNSYKHHVPYSI